MNLTIGTQKFLNNHNDYKFDIVIDKIELKIDESSENELGKDKSIYGRNRRNRFRR
jgi:hypothetical protein